MESKTQSVITDLGIKELNHPNLPGNSLRVGFGFFFCLFYKGSGFSTQCFLLKVRWQN